MKAFEYAAPESEAEVLELLSHKRGATAVLAGGTDLVGLMKQMIITPDRVVSLKNVGSLRSIDADSQGVQAGAMELGSLLIILMVGVEIFRPMRELRTVLHQGMVGMSAAQGIYQIFDSKPLVADAPATALDRPLEPSIAFENVGFRYPGPHRLVHDGLDFRVAAGERIGIVGSSGGGKSSIVRLLLRWLGDLGAQ